MTARDSLRRDPAARSIRLASGSTRRPTKPSTCPTLLALGVLLATSVFASPGAPDRDRHPYVGLIVRDLGDGRVDPDCHISLISATEAVTANHCAQRGSVITFTLDNPVVQPATLYTGVARLGGFDFGDFAVDVAIVDLDAPIDLPRYARIPTGPIAYGPGDVLDFVTYIGANRAALTRRDVVTPDKYLQKEPAHVDFDRNVMQTSTVQGDRNTPTTITEPSKEVATTNLTCFGNSGSPILLAGTDVVVGVLSRGDVARGARFATCLGGGDSVFARTDSELALGILNGTVTPPPPPPPPTVFPRFIEGEGTSGTTSFPARIIAGAEYTGSVVGMAPATELTGTVAQGEVAVFPASLTPGFRSFLAELANDFTGGNDDLDLYFIWTIDGDPYYLFFSGGPTSDEIAEFSANDLAFFAPLLDDPYHFEIWVHGYATEFSSSTFTLFEWQLGSTDEGNATVDPVTADPLDPVVEIHVQWFGLDPAVHKHLGIIDHFIDGIPQPEWKSTFIRVNVP